MKSNTDQAVSSADIVVVGNGALGLFIADEIIRRDLGKSLLVVGPRSRDGGASQAAGAMLGCFGEVTTDTLRTDEGRQRFEVGLEAHKFWDSTLKRLQNIPSVTETLKVAEDTNVILNSVGSELDSENFAAIISALNEYKQPWSETDPRSIRGYNPRPDCRAFRAINLPDEGGIDGRGVLSALELSLEQAGAPILDRTVSRIISKGGTATGVELDDGSLIDAEIIIVAAGAWSEQLVRSASDDLDIIPTFPGLGFAMIANRSNGDSFQSVVRTPNRAFACGLHVVPGGECREYIGATNSATHQLDGGVRFQDLQYLSKYAMQQLDENIATHQVERWLRGLRPITLDGFPLVGWLPVKGMYLVTGTFRDGFHGAPFMAAHVANEIEGSEGLISPMFCPTRAPIVTRTIEYSIEECAHHSVANWFENGDESTFLTTTDLVDYYREKVSRIYDELAVDYALPPEVLWYAVDDPDERIKQYLRDNKPSAPRSACKDEDNEVEQVA